MGPAARVWILWIAAGLGKPLPVAAADPAALNIRVIEGEGSTYVIGSRATRGVTVLIADEAGAPVDGAIVSFSLPPDGPSGAFANGTRTEIVTTRPDGRASAWGMQWNRTPGTLEIRVTALKGQARAGITATEYLASTANSLTPSAGKTNPSTNDQLGSSSQRVLGVKTPKLAGHRWLWMTAAIVGAAVAGAAIAGHGGSSAAATAAPASTVQIGTPTITLGRP